MKAIYNRLTGIGVVCILLLVSCNSKPEYTDAEIPLHWARTTTYITQYTPSNSPTFASRAFAYIGLTMYESVVHGDSTRRTLAGQLSGLDSLPLPEPDSDYDWRLALNAGQASILRNIYIQTSDANMARIDSLETAIYESVSSGVDDATASRSVAYGQAVATAIFEWSKSDGGHRGYLKNFDKNLVHPDFPGSWKPPLFAQSFSHHPLHPHWGNNRTFVPANREIPLPEYLPYDTVPGSAYYEQFRQVYEKERVLTREEKEAAIWWGDDPDVSFTPPGHSYYIATLALEQKRPSLFKSAEVMAKTGMAVADAFIKCWEWKYHFFTERPNTFIPKFIDPEWESFWPDPPFPSFPSGHAIQAAAAATVLEDSFGTSFDFTDRAHEGRPRDEIRDTDFKIRSFHSFWEAAQETADSRFYGGIHTPIDNRVGLEEGARIAGNVLKLNWDYESQP